MTERIRRHVWVSGIVQGVFFRAETARMARGLELGGWVRNLPDGRVEAVFEGFATDVDCAVAWCRHGPRSAVVKRLEVSEETPENTSVFSVR